MRQTVAALLLGAAGFLGSLILERYMKALPEWVWRTFGLLCLLIGLVGAMLADTGWTFLRTTQPVILYAAAGIVGAAFSIAVVALILRLLALSKPQRQSDTKRTLTDDLDAQRQLIAALRKYGGGLANVEIHFANNRQRPLAGTLQSVFELAEWKAKVTNVAFDRYMDRHFPGVEVRGYNKHLVEAVAGALTAAGLPEVWANTQTPSIGRDDEGWAHSQHRIYITIGHISD
jgi:hypothetical protein